MAISLLLVDEQDIFCRGLQVILAGKKFSVLGSLRNLPKACETVRSLKPDMVLLGEPAHRLESFFQTFHELRSRMPSLPLVAMFASENPVTLRRANIAGATHFFLKSASATRASQVLLEAYDGREEKIRKAWMQFSLDGQMNTSALDEPLTLREAEVLRLLTFGMINKEIATALGISLETVKEHVQNILRKLCVENRTQAAVLAVRRGWVKK